MTDATSMLRTLGNEVVEIRAWTQDRVPLYGYFCDWDEAAAAAIRLSESGWHGRPLKGVYVTIHELNDSFRETADNTVRRAGKGDCTSAPDVARYRHLFVDIDAIKAEGFKDDPATDDEHAAVLAIAERAVALTKELGWPEPLVVDSGNGVYSIFRIDLPNNQDTRELVKAVLKRLADELDNEHGHVDKGVHDPPRVARLAGTVNRRGTESADRPYRMAHVVSAPPELLPVTEEQLRDFASPVDSPSPTQRSREPNPALQQANLQAIEKYLEATQFGGFTVTHDSDYIKVSLPHCTRGPAYNGDGNPAILIYPDGGIGYHCFHSKCDGMTWEAFQEHVGIEFKEILKECATEIATGQSNYAVDDPFLLARKHIDNTRLPDGTRTLSFFNGELHQYSEDGWRQTSQKLLNPFVRTTIQEIFDLYALCRGKTPQRIHSSLLVDTYNAIQSEVKRELPPTQQPPFWLENNEWQAGDLLVVRNGILNVARFADGYDDFILPRSPKLFYGYHSDFNFDLNAPTPTEWRRFIKSLEQDEDWERCLQQIMGYLLWRGYDLQRYFVLVGPTRSGKGTIAKVSSDLVGGPLAVCGLDLEDFGTQFGLEQAIGKQLALVPEIRLPNKGVHRVASRLKAVTGGDLISINRKNQPIVSMRLNLKIVMQTNDFVAFPDNSGALHARVLPLKLTKSFRGEEDLTLQDKLAAEYPAILNWSLQGLRDLRANKGRFTIPDSTLDELEQLRDESAPLQAFVEECCLVDSRKAVQSKSLHAIYKDWVASNASSGNQLSLEEFASELKSTVSTVMKKKAKRPNAREHDGREIVRTHHDGSATTRQYLWLGICPNNEWAQAL